ncbi:MAG TPA: hypothetical protein VE684_18190 [Crenalkalicoccus sp.]|jgi:hypothetical protein|nr:hypothetical protein [Crenalkalicoccus sp.]
MRLALVLAAALLLGGAAPLTFSTFSLPATDRFQPVSRAFDWLTLRDREAPANAPETGMVLIRVHPPVPAADRPGRLAAMLRNIRVFRFGALPAAEQSSVAGLPAEVIETQGISAQSLLPVRVRAMEVYGPGRSWLLVASAPPAEWSALEPEVAKIFAGFRPR